MTVKAKPAKLVKVKAQPCDECGGLGTVPKGPCARRICPKCGRTRFGLTKAAMAKVVAMVGCLAILQGCATAGRREIAFDAVVGAVVVAPAAFAGWYAAAGRPFARQPAPEASEPATVVLYPAEEFARQAEAQAGLEEDFAAIEAAARAAALEAREAEAAFRINALIVELEARVAP